MKTFIKNLARVFQFKDHNFVRIGKMVGNSNYKWYECSICQMRKCFYKTEIKGIRTSHMDEMLSCSQYIMDSILK